MNTTLFRRVLFLSLLVGVSHHSFANERIAEATVQLNNNLPCFGISSGEPSSSLLSLIVYDKRARPSKKIWQISTTGKMRYPLISGKCITYGATPPGMRSGLTAQTLESGALYSVFISVVPQNPRSPTQGYTRSFCIKLGTPVTLSEVTWDSHKQRWRDEACQITTSAK